MCDRRYFVVLPHPFSSSPNEQFCFWFRICHCEGDDESPLITPCHCTGSLHFVHQACLQQWIKSSDTRCCELCKYEFIMETKLKPLRKVGTEPASPRTCFFKQRSTLEQPAASTVYLLRVLWLLSKFGQSCIGTKGFELTLTLAKSASLESSSDNKAQQLSVSKCVNIYIYVCVCLNICIYVHATIWFFFRF